MWRDTEVVCRYAALCDDGDGDDDDVADDGTDHAHVDEFFLSFTSGMGVCLLMSE